MQFFLTTNLHEYCVIKMESPVEQNDRNHVVFFARKMRITIKFDYLNFAILKNFSKKKI